jgi:hypothetical protein
MVQTADSRQCQQLTPLIQARLHQAARWRLLPQAVMRTVAVIVRQIFTAHSSEMLLIQRNDVIHHLSPATADPTFRCSDPRWSPQIRPMVVTSKPANENAIRTSHILTLAR